MNHFLVSMTLFSGVALSFSVKYLVFRILACKIHHEQEKR